jgi:hypothetical protein
LANAACIDVKQTRSFSFEGTLSYGIFPGPRIMKMLEREMLPNLPRFAPQEMSF